jgi:[acyl-carrier-protein] S-malonyltransferase
MAEKVTGMEITSLCFEGPLDKLTETSNLQPCLTTVSLAAVAALEKVGIRPQATAGHSVGEYPALTAAGVLPAERAVALTAMRGDYMARDAHQTPGAMAAIIGRTLAEVQLGLKEAQGLVQVGNHNAEKQVVITGESSTVQAAAATFKKQGAKVVPLRVSGAWHSRLMSRAANDFAVRLAQTTFSDASIPVYLNKTGQSETNGDRIAELMVTQLVSPVRWYDIMVNMRLDGFDTFVEVGPKNVLAGLLKKFTSDEDGVGIFNVDGPDGVENLAAVLA